MSINKEMTGLQVLKALAKYLDVDYRELEGALLMAVDKYKEGDEL